MNKKSGLSLVFLSLIITILFVNPVSAAADIGESIRQILDGAISFASPVFEILLGSYSSSDLFAARILLFILLFATINAVFKRIPLFKDQINQAIPLIVSLSVSILAIRFISEDLINDMILPYTTLGIAITTIIPFLIFFYFVHTMGMGSAGRRLSWIFFAIVFVTLWISRSDQLSSLGNQIYGWTAAVIVLVIFFDRQIHQYMGLSELRAARRSQFENRIAELQSDISNIRAHPYGPTGLSPDQQRVVDRKEKEIASLYRRK